MCCILVYVFTDREKLDSMEIPYLVRNLPKGYTSGRKEFAAKYADKLSSFRKSAGFVMVPLLVDPNTGMGSTKNIKYNMLRVILTVI
jgi:hypothetical protein